MKKLLFVFLLALPVSVIAQKRAGILAAYGTKPGQPAIGANAEFFIDKKLSISPCFLFYFPESTPVLRHSWFEINFDGHYYVYTYKIFEFYAIGGVNFTYHDYKDKVVIENSYRTGTFNLNFGGGVNFKFSDVVFPFSEIRYAIGGTDQVVVSAGARIRF